MSDIVNVRPHYVYVVVVDGEIRKVCKSEVSAYAYLETLGMMWWLPEARECIMKFNLTTGERVHGRQSLT